MVASNIPQRKNPAKRLADLLSIGLGGDIKSILEETGLTEFLSEKTCKNSRQRLNHTISTVETADLQSKNYKNAKKSLLSYVGKIAKQKIKAYSEEIPRERKIPENVHPCQAYQKIQAYLEKGEAELK